MRLLVVFAATLFPLFSALPIYAEEKGFFSNMLDDIKKSGAGNIFERKKIREWYKENKGKLVIVDGSETLGCENKEKDDRNYLCSLKVKMTNNTNDELVALVVRIKVYNKSKSILVMEEVHTLRLSIFPTVEKSVGLNFSFSGDGNYSKIGKAKTQLGNNFSWNYDLVAYLPDHLYEKDVMEDMGISINGLRGQHHYDWLAE